jgi:DNA-binding XRE family transcriptional regulator
MRSAVCYFIYRKALPINKVTTLRENAHLADMKLAALQHRSGAKSRKRLFIYWGHQNEEVTSMTFAEKLKSIRKQAGMSQEQLAEKLGVSRQALTKWETNAGIPDIENMMAISGELVIYTSSDETYAGGGK